MDIGSPDNFQTFVIGIAGVGVVGFVAWTINNINRGARALDAFKLEVANTYIKNGGVDELKAELHALRNVVYQIAYKMGIPIRAD
jgi:hypothetical protein